MTAKPNATSAIERTRRDEGASAGFRRSLALTLEQPEQDRARHLASIHGDVQKIVSIEGWRDEQWLRRAYVRAVAASVEAQLAALEGLLATTTKGLKLTQDGAVSPQGGSPDFRTRTLYLLNRRAAQLSAGLTLHRNQRWWNPFTVMIRVRNRITHPPTDQSPDVSDAELQLVGRAHGRWSWIVAKLASKEHVAAFRIAEESEVPRACRRQSRRTQDGQ